MRGPHDVGGLEAGPVETEAHPLTFWEKQIDAVNALLSAKGLKRTDENRRYIEMLGHDGSHKQPALQQRHAGTIEGGAAQRQGADDHCHGGDNDPHRHRYGAGRGPFRNAIQHDHLPP